VLCQFRPVSAHVLYIWSCLPNVCTATSPRPRPSSQVPPVLQLHWSYHSIYVLKTGTEREFHQCPISDPLVHALTAHPVFVRPVPSHPGLRLILSTTHDFGRGSAGGDGLTLTLSITHPKLTCRLPRGEHRIFGRGGQPPPGPEDAPRREEGGRLHDGGRGSAIHPWGGGGSGSGSGRADIDICACQRYVVCPDLLLGEGGI